MARNKVRFDSTYVKFIFTVYWNCIIFNNRNIVDHISRNLFYTSF